MEPICNEIMIESSEITLLVEEGLVGNVKITIDKIIKRIRELIAKILNFIKSKLIKQTKNIEEEIKVAEKKAATKEIKPNVVEPKEGKPHVAEPQESKPIRTLDIKKAQNLQSAIRLLLDTAFKIITTASSDVSGDIDTLTDDLEALKKLNEKYTSNLLIDHIGDTSSLVKMLKPIHDDAKYHIDRIVQLEQYINKRMDYLKTHPSEGMIEKFKLINLIQASVSFANRLNSIIISNVNATMIAINK